MYINFFKSAVTDKVERIETKPNTLIKDVIELKDLDFSHTLIFVNGFQKDENYKLRKDDVCTVRYFPANSGGGGGYDWFDLAKDFFTGGLYSATKLAVETTKWLVEMVNGLLNTPKYQYQNYIDNRDYSTKITQNIIQSQKAIKSPDMRGCSNQLELNQPYPLVIGKSYFVPRMIAKPYITPYGDYGDRQTFHALYDLGYNNVNVTNICLGLKQLASNSAKQRNGAIVIDGFYDSDKYDIHLEIQETDEVSLYPQSVVQQDVNAELLYPKPAQGEQARNFVYDGFSALYPQKVEVEFYFDGLVGKLANGDDKGGDTTATVKVKLEYSTDGGETFHPFGKIGNVSGITYDSSTGETTFTMKEYRSMRFVATKEFSASEVFNATNHVIELRVQRTNVHDDDAYIYDTVSLASIRTYCYDPNQSSSSNLVPQRPLVAKDRQRLTRLGFTITSDEILNNLGEFNCIVQALGRTCTESNGVYTWGNELVETSNPASMALRLLQCSMLGEYIYTDSEIDMQKFGELYKFCDEYDINDAQGNHVGICANGVVTKQEKLSDLLSKILAVGRAYRIVSVGKISLFIDKPIEFTSLILNNQNVIQASNTKDFEELPSGIKAEFVNEDNYNQDDVMYIDYEDAPEHSSILYKTISKRFEFQTNVEQIQKNGLYELARMKLRPENWSRTVLSEGSLAYVGAKIEVQDDTLAVGIGDGAEIKNVKIEGNYITEIVTDGEFDVTDLTKEYGIEIQVATLEYGLVYLKRKVVIETSGVYSTFVFTDPISLDEPVLPAVGDIISFGIFTKITYEAICMSKKPDGNGMFQLSLVPYVEAIYNADKGVLPEFDSKTTAPTYIDPLHTKDPITQEDVQGVKNDLIDLKNGSAEIGNPDAPVSITAIAGEHGIELSWTPVTGGGLSNSIRQYNVEKSTDSGTTWSPLFNTYNSNGNYVFDRAQDKDGYPEASVFNTWRFRVRAENIYSKFSEWKETTVNTNNYGTWVIPALSATQEILDRTAIVKVIYNTPQRPLYGSQRLQLKIKRIGSDDPTYGTQFNQMLAITPDTQFYKPNFNDLVGYSDTEDNEPNYRKYGEGSDDWYTTDLYQFSHTLPLIGQTPRIFKENNVPVLDSENKSVFTKDVPDEDEVPQSPSEGDVIRYMGADGTLKTGFYYLYENSVWVQVFSKSNAVETTYQYLIQMTNESGKVTAMASPIKVTVLPTNISDIVHSHEHYKSLYVEKLSAISANIGMISQGGMGSFEEMLNCWALSDIYPEDSGIAKVIKKGTFRVGGENEYFRVTPIDDNGNYKIELKAGNIELSSDVGESSQMDFTNGTYIYTGDRSSRLKLTPSGIIAEKLITTAVTPQSGDNPFQKGWYEFANGKWSLTSDISVVSGKTYYSGDWQEIAKVIADSKGNMILTNSDNIPPFGYQVENADVYHIENSAHPEYEESASPSNPQSLSFVGTVEDISQYTPILDTASSTKCFNGKITKDVSNWTGRVVFFSKSHEVTVGDKGISIDGSSETVPAPLTGYNEAMKETSTIDQTKTVGAYLGLSELQVQNGIFY